MCLSGLGGLGLYRQGEVPGQQFLDTADGMVGDLGEHGAEMKNSGSRPFSFADPIKLYMAAARSPPQSEPANK